MMENDGGEGDDQGSGWFEVKKKHRTSSKLSIQRVSGVSSNKSQSYSPRYQALTNDEVGNLQCEWQIQHSKAGTGFGIHSKVSGCSRGSSSAAVDYGKNCQDKSVVNQENKSPDTLSSASTKVTDLETGPIASQEVPIKENLGCSPKIKWGDLEDVAFIPSEYCDDFVKNRTERGDVKVASTQEHDNAVGCSEPVECDSSHSSLQEGKLTSEDAECFPDGILSSGVNKERLEGRCEEVCEIIPTILGSVNANLEGELSNLKKDDECARSALNEAGNELDSNDAAIETFPSSPVAGVVEITIQEPYNKIEDGALNVSGVSVINEKADMNAGLQDIFSLPPLENCTEISIDTSAITTMENRVGLQEDSTDAAELGEGEQGESKERFRQRLWCFLFENLNRAVDELYLLCELECDMEQMNEAILVLDEAASDFKELKSRVEHFESTKKSATQSSKDGMAVNAKTDHRRPHALSWEVMLLIFSGGALILMLAQLGMRILINTVPWTS